jgi:hypothetical protein
MAELFLQEAGLLLQLLRLRLQRGDTFIDPLSRIRGQGYHEVALNSKRNQRARFSA